MTYDFDRDGELFDALFEGDDLAMILQPELRPMFIGEDFTGIMGRVVSYATFPGLPHAASAWVFIFGASWFSFDNASICCWIILRDCFLASSSSSDCSQIFD